MGDVSPAGVGRARPGKITFLLATLRLKLLAIAFAVALWSVVAYAQNPTQSHSYGIRMDTPVLPAGLVLVGDVPQVSLTAIGTSDHMRAFDAQLRANPSMLHISGIFSGAHVGRNDVPIHVNNPDPTITIVAPSSVTDRKSVV